VAIVVSLAAALWRKGPTSRWLYWHRLVLLAELFSAVAFHVAVQSQTGRMLWWAILGLNIEEPGYRWPAQIAGASFDGRVASALDLLEAGEAGIAFENLAQTVYEFDRALSAPDYQQFEEVGRSLALPPEAWTFLRELIR